MLPQEVAEEVRVQTEESVRWLERRLEAVRVKAPPGATLSGVSGSFAATITNRLDEPVTVSLKAITDADLSIDTPISLVLAPGGSQTVLLETRTSAPGVHYARLVVTDGSGGLRDTKTFRVDVAGRTPTVAVGADESVGLDGQFARVGSFADPGLQTWTARVDYGDGAGPQALALNPDRTFRLAHHYPTAGAFPVTVTVAPTAASRAGTRWTGRVIRAG